MSPLTSLVPIYLLETKRWDFYGVLELWILMVDIGSVLPKNEEEEEKEEDPPNGPHSSLYSRPPWIWATARYGRECTWPRTPLLTHACACATILGQVMLSSPNTIARARVSPTHTHARAPPLDFPALVQFLRFVSCSISHHFICLST